MDASNPSGSVSILHVPGPQCDGQRDRSGAAAGVIAHAEALRTAGAPAPDLVVVSGNLTKSANPSGMEEALRFLTELRDDLAPSPERLVVIPGRGDVSRQKCRAHFALCEDEEVQPHEPYFPKLERFAQIFADLYGDVDGAGFDEHEPWTMFGFDELNLVIAGFNSTWSMTHRPEDDGGSLGTRQMAAFARQLGEASESGRLCLGAMNHAPVTARTRLRLHYTMLQDTRRFEQQVGSRLHLLLHGAGADGRDSDESLYTLDEGLLASAALDETPELVTVTDTEVRVWTRPGTAAQRRTHD
ncbi:MAG: hypothetical protein ACRD0P_19175, partial [Stackebrandtia sp.]